MSDIECDDVMSTIATILLLTNTGIVCTIYVTLMALYVKNQLVFGLLTIPLITLGMIFSICGGRILYIFNDNNTNNTSNNNHCSGCNCITNYIPTPPYTEVVTNTNQS